jgi:hypothetical protein
MATFTKVKLSYGGDHNRPIDPAWGSDAWIPVHQTGTSSTILDEVWLWISNPNTVYTAEILVRVHNGSTGVNIARVVIPPKTMVLALPGHPVCGDGTISEKVEVLDASLEDSNSVVFGYVNRITP